jgi:Ca2+/Na+ antiporter
MNIYRIMIANAVVLIGLGVYGYFLSGSPTALIAPGIGVILILLSIPVKNENQTAAHIAVVITLISSIMFFVTGFLRANLLVIVMALFTTFALYMYIMDFVRRKKERENTVK